MLNHSILPSHRVYKLFNLRPIANLSSNFLSSHLPRIISFLTTGSSPSSGALLWGALVLPHLHICFWVGRRPPVSLGMTLPPWLTRSGYGPHILMIFLWNGNKADFFWFWLRLNQKAIGLKFICEIYANNYLSLWVFRRTENNNLL